LRILLQQLEAANNVVPEPLQKSFGPYDVELAKKGILAWIDNIRGSSSLMHELGESFFKHHSLEDPKNTAISILLALWPKKSSFNEADTNRINNLHQACIAHTEYNRENNLRESRCLSYFELVKLLKLETQKQLDLLANQKIEKIEALLQEREDLIKTRSFRNFRANFLDNKSFYLKMREINRRIFDVLAPEFVETLNSGNFSLNSKLTYCFSAFVVGPVPRHMKLAFQEYIDKAEIPWTVSSCLLNTLWGTDLRRERERLGKSDFPF
ncbi:MAG: hypothetical protein GYA55_01955, partial [SAR324 cluster bacterium]|nr:hypothetical protein [SAR324 cluster bacterium]